MTAIPSYPVMGYRHLHAWGASHQMWHVPNVLCRCESAVCTLVLHNVSTNLREVSDSAETPVKLAINGLACKRERPHEPTQRRPAL